MGDFGALLCLVAALALVGAGPARAEILVGLGAPMTGPYSWPGGTTKETFELAIADLNARGGVLGQTVQVIEADDYCDGEQAVAAANKLLAAGVAAVFGHQCSGAAIPASKIYAGAGILMIVTEATNPLLTEQGFTNVFRMVGRDDVQGRIAGDLLAGRWSGKRIAILHDGTLCWVGSGSMPRRTSAATRRSSGTSGRAVPPCAPMSSTRNQAVSCCFRCAASLSASATIVSVGLALPEVGKTEPPAT
jgi:branched-chain amino acid transport system substrate-binding protein